MKQLNRRQRYFRQHYFLLFLCCLLVIFLIIQTARVIFLKDDLKHQVTQVSHVYATPHIIPWTTSTPIPTATPFPIMMVTPTPIPSLGDDPEDVYKGEVLTAVIGTVEGPSGRETYYNLPMDYVVELMRDMGYSVEDYPYWIRTDGCKMFGPYIMCAADLSIRPKGTILKSSLGDCIVVDTGDFIYSNPMQIDIAVNW